MRIRATLCLFVLLLAAGAGTAVRAASPPPGALPFEELEILPREELTTEINLEGPVLKLISSATGDDPDFSRLVAGLQAIRVQVAPLKAADPAKVRGKIDRTVHWMEGRGWTAVVRTKEKGEETYIYTKVDKGEMVGLTVLSFEPGKEVSVINIVGRLDPAQLGRLGQGLHMHQFDNISPKDKEKPRDPKHPG